MGVELELGVLLFIAILGPAAFAVFEIETPWWRKAFKWFLISTVTIGLHRVVGHWALAVPVGMLVAGCTFHFWWCRKNGIDPFRATPRDRYYRLRGWAWPA